MTAAWPITVQSSPLIGTLSFTDEDNVLKTQNDIGPPIRRARYTSVLRHFSFETLLSKDAWENLDTFYRTTLGLGVLEFTMTDPVTGTIETFNFDAPPQVNSVAAIDYYNVGIKASRLVST